MELVHNPGTTLYPLPPVSCDRSVYEAESILVWGGRLSKRFCSMFSGNSPCLLGQHGSCSSAQLPVELSENMLQNLFLNLPPQTVATVAAHQPWELPKSSSPKPYDRVDEKHWTKVALCVTHAKVKKSSA